MEMFVVMISILMTKKLLMPGKKMLFLFFLLIFFSCAGDGVSVDPKDSKTEIGESKYFEGGFNVMNQRGERFFMDKKGNVPKELTYQSVLKNIGGVMSSMDHFHEDISVIMKKDGGSLKWGYIDREGKQLFQKWFDYAGEFKSGFAIVKYQGKWGGINNKGEFVIPNVYEGVSDISEKEAWIKEEGVWKMVSLPEMESRINIPVRIFGESKEGIRWIEKMNDDPDNIERAYINSKGEVLTEWFSNATDFSEGLAAIEKNGSWGYINLKGEMAIEPSLGYSSQFSEGLAAFTSNDGDRSGKWGYINQKGEVKIPQQFYFADAFRNGMAEVRNEKGERGFINKQGQLVVDYKFESVNNFSEDFAAVQLEKKWGFIDTSGTLVIRAVYDKIAPFHDEPLNGGFSGGVAKVEIDGHEFFIDPKGRCLLGCLE